MEYTEILSWWSRVTQGYAGAEDWRSGLGLCAVMARFRPDLLPYSSLDPDNSTEHTRLALTICRDLGIDHSLEPNQLDSEDNVLSLLVQLHHKFSQLNPQPASRRSVKREEQGEGLSSVREEPRESSTLVKREEGGESFPLVKREDSGVGESLSSSSQSSLESCLQFLDDKSPGETETKLEMNDRIQHRSCESLVTSGAGGARKKSESFTQALKKFSSLSSSNITINLPALSAFTDVKPKPETQSSERRESQLVTTSTQTESLEKHGLSERVASLSVSPVSSEVYYKEMRGGGEWYSTEYYRDYHMYSTLV